MDWAQTAVTGAVVALGYGASQISHNAKFGQRVETLEKVTEGHDAVLKEHAGRFEDLPVKYVPRTEMVEKLDAIRKSTETVQRWLEYLLFNRKQVPTSASGMPPAAQD